MPPFSAPRNRARLQCPGVSRPPRNRSWALFVFATVILKIPGVQGDFERIGASSVFIPLDQQVSTGPRMTAATHSGGVGVAAGWSGSHREPRRQRAVHRPAASAEPGADAGAARGVRCGRKRHVWRPCGPPDELRWLRRMVRRRMMRRRRRRRRTSCRWAAFEPRRLSPRCCCLLAAAVRSLLSAERETGP